MPSPQSIFRPNYSRSVSVIGEFNDDLAARVLPEILRLRHESTDPVTVYIHSPGGQVNTLEGFDCAIQTGHYGITSPRIITVAVGDVSSAAANLLALGDYAIGYPQTEILFHGVRMGEVQVTVEGAQNTAGRLARLNRKISQKIAMRILPRVVFRFLQLRAALKKTGKLQPNEAVPLFEKAIKARVGPAARRVLRRTCAKLEGAASLSNKIVPQIKFSKTFNPKIDDPKVLKAVLKHEIKNSKRANWELDESGIQQLVDDYLLLRSWHVSTTDEMYVVALDNFGPDFFTPSEAKKYKKLKQSDPHQAFIYLNSIAGPYVSQIWYYTVTLSSNLFVGENPFSSSDAYWLGIIDEVMGMNLKCMRSVVEGKNTSQPAPPASAHLPAPPPPAP